MHECASFGFWKIYLSFSFSSHLKPWNHQSLFLPLTVFPLLLSTSVFQSLFILLIRPLREQVQVQELTEPLLLCLDVEDARRDDLLVALCV